ncbi:hypothetical protein ACPXCS_32260 [Streptomyces sp. DT190]|uniref:hypothetical protein n=1 Tax=unclassified Streptomyces TaxID=2593676 RepID=UPI003CEA814C
MNYRTTRWLLAPLRQLRTRRLMAQHGPALPYDTAWALITLHTAPDETALVRAWANEHPGTPGVHHDYWHKLSSTEQRRRRAWLQRNGHSPIQLLGLDPLLVHSTGLHVLDWGRPPEPGNTFDDEQVSGVLSKEPAPRGGDGISRDGEEGSRRADGRR